MEEELRHRLAAIVGREWVGGDNLVDPAGVGELRAILARCAEAGVTVAPTRSPQAITAGVVVSAERVDAVRVDAANLLVHAGAAAAWSVLHEALGRRRLVVAGMPPVRSDTVGESVARGELAHRALAGVDLLTPAGELISAGGWTLKDVVGYDLSGLVLGSGDRLGLIVAVTLRLEPQGARTPVEPGAGPWRGEAGIDVAAAFAAGANASGEVARL